jgi:choline dehydrogenase-like flavoprotein
MTSRRQFLGAVPGLALVGAGGAHRRGRQAAASGHHPSDGGGTPREPFDVCVIGAGPAGAVLACRLVEHGLSTVWLEGGASPASSGAPGRAAFDLDATPRYPVEATRFRGPGGTSNLWGGGSARLRPLDFAAGNAYAEAPWPITHAELEHRYAMAERELSVQPPREARATHALADLLRRSGLVAEPNPVASADGVEPLRVARTHLPRFSASPLASFLDGHEVTRLEIGSNGAVDGAAAWTPQGRRTIRARAYVLASGGIETPRLLLLSRSPRFPDGIGNHSGLLGRYFTEHLAIDLGSAQLRDGAALDRPAEVVSWQFYEEFKHRGLGGVVLEIELAPPSTLRLSAVLEMKPSPSNRVWLDENARDAHGDPRAAVSVGLSPLDRRTIARLAEVAAEVRARLGAPRLSAVRELVFCHHHMGTCRMGADAGTSVVDPELRVHGVPNLYVAGSAPFVTGGAGGPTLLIAALALRLADHLRDTLGARARRGARA